ncbi:DUF6418 domain-containing protein [Trinickia violacea]|uniref:DUF6418 domain-containing protein n=1 Tax=Trinickia violacea TaxID=2571746 RepID=UPI0015864692|nr:DUF6418 domain-containing protein [Trinickia violacea]
MKPESGDAKAVKLWTAIILILLVLVNSFLPYTNFNEFSAPVTFILATAATIVLLIVRPVFAISILYLLMLALTAFIAGIGTEAGGLLTETGVLGEPDGAFSRLLLFYIVFVAAAFLGFDRTFDEKKSRGLVYPAAIASRKNLYSGIALVCLIVVAGVGAGALEGFAFLQGVNRYALRNDSSSLGGLLFSTFLNNRMFMAIFLGILIAAGKGWQRWLAVVLAAVGALLSVLHGEQFMATLQYCLSVLTPVVAINVIEQKPVLRYLGFGALVALLVGGVSVYYAYQAQGFDVDEMVLVRFLLQGQAWYVVDGDSGFLSAPALGGIHAFARFLGSLINWSSPSFDDYTHLSGLRDLMVAYGLPSVMDAYVTDNVTFTMGQMAVPVFWFGMLGGAIFVFFTGYLLGILCGWQIRFIIRGGVVGLWFVTKVSYYAAFGMQQGEYWNIFGIRMLFFVTLTVVWCFLFESGAERGKVGWRVRA